MGKTLIIIGIVFVLAGIVVSMMPGTGIPRLPGDIHVRGENYTFYFPLGWSILISVLASLLWWLFSR